MVGGEGLDAFVAEIAGAEEEAGEGITLGGVGGGEVVLLGEVSAEGVTADGVEDLEGVEAVEAVFAAGAEVVFAAGPDELVLDALGIAGLVVVRAAADGGEAEVEVGVKEDVGVVPDVRGQAEGGGVEADGGEGELVGAEAGVRVAEDVGEAGS